MFFYFWNTIQIGHKLQWATITLIPSSYLDFFFPSSVHCMMNLISSELLKKEITALPKQMAAVMNTTAESHSEILLMRKNYQYTNFLSQLYICPVGEDWFLYVSRCWKSHFKFNCYIFILCVYIYTYMYIALIVLIKKLYIYICL